MSEPVCGVDSTSAQSLDKPGFGLVLFVVLLTGADRNQRLVR